MKALIVTTQYVYNYGAVLQAFGLSQFLRKHKWDHEFLNQKFFPQKMKPFSKQWTYSTFNYIRSLPSLKKEKVRIKRFDSFILEHFPLTKLIENKYAPLSIDLDYDLYITGGDQLFNRTCLTEPFNFLQFCNSKSPRISYSTSFGSAIFSEEEKELIRGYLENYSEISLREKVDINGFKQLRGLPIRTDLDGSLLLDISDWEKVERSVDDLPEEGYILVYELLPNAHMVKATVDLKEKLRLPVVLITVQDKTYINADVVIRDAGPGEFLYLFHNSTAVLTTSFHGVCFSIAYRKPFYALIQKSEKRINSLLDGFNLHDRYGLEMSEWPGDIDYSFTKRIINERRNDAEVYLGRYFENHRKEQE